MSINDLKEIRADFERESECLLESLFKLNDTILRNKLSFKGKSIPYTNRVALFSTPVKTENNMRLPGSIAYFCSDTLCSDTNKILRLWACSSDEKLYTEFSTYFTTLIKQANTHREKREIESLQEKYQDLRKKTIEIQKEIFFKQEKEEKLKYLNPLQESYMRLQSLGLL